LDINVRINEKDGQPYFLEWTARFGYSAIYAFMEGLNISLSQFFEELIKGGKTSLKPTNDLMGAVRLTILPYPSEDGAIKSEGKPVRIKTQNKEDGKHIIPLDVKVEKNRLVTAGFDGIICEVTGKGKTPDELGKNIYNLISKVEIPDVDYRTDLVWDITNKFNRLKQAGYM
jgi:phosphoribosylamine-glycine ligase